MIGTALFTLFLLAAAAIGQETRICHSDNCANHVAGTFDGIGVPSQTRVGLCESYLRATIEPAPTTTTRIITIYTTELPVVTATAVVTGIDNSTMRPGNVTIMPLTVPTFASAQCPSAGQFSSACACWSAVTASVTTLPRSTLTATQTTYLDVGCSPAATAAARSQQFPCSRRLGLCSCLRSERDGDVCVRVGRYTTGEDGYGRDESELCEKSKECNASGGCDDPGRICVFDGSCGCGKRRCYRAAPRGCDYQGLPEEDDAKKI